jgi:hypothetical protein
MKNFMSILMITTVICFFTFSCSEDGRDEKPTTNSTQQSTQQLSKQQPPVTNGRVAYSNPNVISELESMGYTVDPNDEEHYSYYMGGVHEVTMHFRGDLVFDDKYKILYESSGHVGEELLYNGYIANSSVLYVLFDGIKVDILL